MNEVYFIMRNGTLIMMKNYMFYKFSTFDGAWEEAREYNGILSGDIEAREISKEDAESITVNYPPLVHSGNYPMSYDEYEKVCRELFIKGNPHFKEFVKTEEWKEIVERHYKSSCTAYDNPRVIIGNSPKPFTKHDFDSVAYEASWEA